MAKKITDKVTWVGKVDWELKSFHGEELSTHKGSSYNSFLIQDEKNVLIDTVYKPFDEEFVSNLKQIIDLKDLDYIVMNHNEIDHSGGLMALIRECPDIPIYCTKNGENIIKAHFHKDLNFVNVKTGDTLDIGKSTLTFIEARMLHWPDTMFTYMSGDNILFSNDGFGQHYAAENFFVREDNLHIAEKEALKYYANILNPFNPIVKKKMNEILDMNLKIDMICPSHGLGFKGRDVDYIINKYLAWSDSYKENQITILYDSMWESTRKMAESIAEGIKEVDDDVIVKLCHASKDDKNDIIAEIFKSKTLVLGSSTVNNGLLHGIAGMLELIKGFKFKNKNVACFGSYGWSGESVGLLNTFVEECGLNKVEDGLRLQWVPDRDGLNECVDFGKKLAKY